MRTGTTTDLKRWLNVYAPDDGLHDGLDDWWTRLWQFATALPDPEQSWHLPHSGQQGCRALYWTNTGSKIFNGASHIQSVNPLARWLRVVWPTFRFSGNLKVFGSTE